MHLEDMAIEEIDADLAGHYLGHNLNNRNPKLRRVNAYATDMVNGKWRWTGEAIKFAADGRLLDGQNRLMAVMKADVPVKFLVIRNVSEHSQEVMDTGAPRSFADALKLRDEISVNQLAAVTRLIYLWEQGVNVFRAGSSTYPASIPTLFETLERHPDLRDSVKRGAGIARHTTLSVTCATFCYYILSTIDAEDADYFFDRLVDGVNLSKDSPIRALRDALGNLTKERGGVQASGRYFVPMAALVFKAWNKYRNGDPTYALRWRSGGAKPEPFPEPK